MRTGLLAAVIALAIAAVGGWSCGSSSAPPAVTSTAAPATVGTSALPSTPTSAPGQAATPGAPSTETAEPATATPRGTSGLAAIISRGPATGRRVTLTFDAGADAGFTTQVLATLKSYGVPAAFGMTGKWAQANPDLVRQIAAAGHLIINHTDDHASFTGLSTGAPALTAGQRLEELQRADGIISSITGVSTQPYFRPPYGDVDDSVAADAGAAGYHYVIMWTVDTLGWNGASADDIVRRSLDLAEPGAILIMHVGSDSQDAAALPRVIEGLRAAGYTLVSLPDLLAG